MNIKTNDQYEYHLDLMRRIVQRTGENTKAGTVDFSLEYSLAMLRNLDRALEHPDMTPELAEVLSTSDVELDYRIETELCVNS